MYQRANGSAGGGGAPCEVGYITDWTSGYYTKTLGFKPKQLALFSLGSGSHTAYFYDVNKSDSKFYGFQGSSINFDTGWNIGGNVYINGIKSIDDDGFKLEKYNASWGSGNIFYMAIG